jgi:hypothetical protein
MNSSGADLNNSSSYLDKTTLKFRIATDAFQEDQYQFDQNYQNTSII